MNEKRDYDEEVEKKFREETYVMKLMVEKRKREKRLENLLKTSGRRAHISSVDTTVSKNVLRSHKKVLMDITFCSIML